MLNKAMVMGYLGRNPEMTYTPDGTPVTKFTLASNFHWTDPTGETRKITEWHNIECWGQLAEACYEYLAKGRLVYAEGRLRTDRWTADGINQRRTFIVASDVRFIPTGQAPPRKAFEVEDLPDTLPSVGLPTEPVAPEEPKRNGRRKKAPVEA